MAPLTSMDDKIALMVGHLLLQLARLELEIDTLKAQLAAPAEPRPVRVPKG